MASTLARRAGEERVDAGGRGSVVGIRMSTYFFQNKRDDLRVGCGV
jgi:hypothetical protein